MDKSIKAMLGRDDPETWGVFREVWRDLKTTGISLTVTVVVLFVPSIFEEWERDYTKGQTPPFLERAGDAMTPNLAGVVLAGVVIVLYLMFVIPLRQRNRARARIGRVESRSEPRDRVRITLPPLVPSLIEIAGRSGTYIEIRFPGARVLSKPGVSAGSFEFQAEIFPTDGRAPLLTSELAEELRVRKDEEFRSILPNPIEAMGHRKRDLVLLAVANDHSLQNACFGSDIQLRIKEAHSRETTVLHLIDGDPVEGTWAELKALSVAEADQT